MTNASSNVRNYFKLELLIGHSHGILRQMFKSRYSVFTGGQIWDDSSTCGSTYPINAIGKNKKFSLTSLQKKLIQNGDSNEWDFTTLTILLLNADRPKTLNTTQIQQLNNEDALLSELRDVRNMLAHHKSRSITDVEFNQRWSKLMIILVDLGGDKSELEKSKDDSVFDTPTQSINEENMNEAIHLNSLGTQAHKSSQFSEAVTLFKKAIVLPGVPNQTRATIYSNLSSSHLALYEQQSNFSCTFDNDLRHHALQDAKQARILAPTWWKSHFCVGKTYAILNEHEKAITSFERALALDPSNKQIRRALDESRHTHGTQLRNEHLDPRLQPVTMGEHLNEMKQKTGTNPENVRSGHRICEEFFPSEADVVRGHKYKHGDIDIKQDYVQAAKYFAKAANQGNAEGIYNLAQLADLGLGVKKDHQRAFELYEQAAAQSPEHPRIKDLPNTGVAEAEHALGLKYMEGIVVHKNLLTAAMWYQRAINHGSPTAANNLGIMYQYGDGIEKDLHKAEELYELSSRRKDPNAMLNLAELLLDKNDFKMSQIWHDRACDAGNIQAQSNRHHFQLRLNIQKQYLRYHPSNSVQMMNKYKNFYSSDVVKPIQKHSHDSRAYNLDELNEYAERGSITAKIMYNALKHFTQASDILKQSEILTKEQERRFVHELAQCYRTEYNVAQVSTVEIREKADKIVDRLLEDCTTKTDAIPSQLDEDVRTCYATLHRESEELIVQFLEPCKQKYPKSIYFFQLSATLNSLLSHYEVALYDINAGLEIDPKSYILLYQKAVILNFFNLEPNELIEAHQAFLAIAPKDHPHVPTMYYSMTIYYLLNYKDNVQMDMIKTIYELGQESEKIQLPYFLPYKSSVRDILKNTFGISTPRNDEKFPLDNRKKRLTNQHRIEIIKKHREWIVPILDTTNNSDLCHISTTVKPRVKQYTAKSLIGLKAISIREMNPTKDHVYSGYVLTVTIIGEPYSWTPSIHLVVEDENLDSERMFIYGFSESQGKHLINEVFTIGSKMSIINPYLRLGAFDHQPLIRVDDFASIITHSESERIINMCRCCGQANAPHVCAICTKARYCSKDCQIMDWKLYEHKLICRKQ